MADRTLLLTLLLCLVAVPADADEAALGRLFFTPQQRAALDRQRLLNPEQRNRAERSESYTINGEVRRSHGLGTRWINGEAETGPRNGPAVPVGDTYHPTTSERQDLLRGGQIVIQPQTPPARP